jgi:hypothetical protein
LDGTEPIVRLTVDLPETAPTGASRLRAAADMVRLWLSLWPDYFRAAFGTSMSVQVATGSTTAANAQRTAHGVEVRLVISVGELQRTAGSLGSLMVAEIVSALGRSDAFQDRPVRFNKHVPTENDIPRAPSLLEEVKDLDEGEMAILARRKESTEGPDFRYRIDVYLAEAIAGQVRSIDGEGDVWRIRL